MNDMNRVIEREKVIVIVRGLYGEQLLKLCDAMYAGGLRLMELTFDQGDPACEQKTPEAIAALCAHMRDAMHFGAGTVLTERQADLAAQAGAEYIISPNTDTSVIRHTKAAGLVSIPGAQTPSEMVAAHRAGADFIKVFPANRLGIGYMKDVMAPLNHLKFIATAGVTLESFPEYLSIGFVGAGVSGYLTNKDLVRNGDWQELARRAAQFHALAHA